MKKFGKPVFVGLVVLSILPFVGWLVDLFSATVGFGAMISLLLKRRDSLEGVHPEMDFSL